MNEIADRQNIELLTSEWRETGPKQGILWRLQTLVQAIAWTILTGCIGPFFLQFIYNLWREAWTGRVVVEIYETPRQIPTPLENPPPEHLIPPPETPPEPFSTREEAQNALKVLFTQPSPDLGENDLDRYKLADQLDLSEAPFISRPSLEGIFKTFSLTEIQLPFPPTWNDWQKHSDLFLSPFAELLCILKAENLPDELKISFNSPLANDMPQKSIPLADLFAALNPQESLRLFKCLRAFSKDQARLFFELLLMSADRNTHCLPQLQAVLSEQPRAYLPLFVNQPQYNSILDAFLNGLSNESLVDLMTGIEAAALKRLFHRLTLQPEKQKLILNQLMSLIPEKEVLVYDLYSNSADGNAFLGFISSYPDLPQLLIKKMQQETSPELISALNYFLSSYSSEVRLERFDALLGNEKDILFEKILNAGRPATPDHSPLFVNLCLVKMQAILARALPEEEKKQEMKDAVQKLSHASDLTTCAQELAKLVDSPNSVLIRQTITEHAFLAEFTKITHEINLEKFISTHEHSNKADLSKSNPLFPLNQVNLKRIFLSCSDLKELKWDCQNDLSPLLENLPEHFILELTPQTSEAFESLVPLLTNKEKGRKLFNALKSFLQPQAQKSQANLFLEVATKKFHNTFSKEEDNFAEITSYYFIDEMRNNLPGLAQIKESYNQNISDDAFEKLIRPLSKEYTDLLLAFCEHEIKLPLSLAKLMAIQPHNDNVLFSLFSSFLATHQLLLPYLIQDPDKAAHLTLGILNSNLSEDNKNDELTRLLRVFEDQPFEKIQPLFTLLLANNCIEKIYSSLLSGLFHNLQINIFLAAALHDFNNLISEEEKEKSLINYLKKFQNNNECKLFVKILSKHCETKHIRLIIRSFAQFGKGQQQLAREFMQEINEELINTNDLDRYESAWMAFLIIEGAFRESSPNCLFELLPTIDSNEKLECIVKALKSFMKEEEVQDKIKILRDGFPYFDNIGKKQHLKTPLPEDSFLKYLKSTPKKSSWWDLLVNNTQ